jgi:hypothetical protein
MPEAGRGPGGAWTGPRRGVAEALVRGWEPVPGLRSRPSGWICGRLSEGRIESPRHNMWGPHHPAAPTCMLNLAVVAGESGANPELSRNGVISVLLHT